MDILETTDSIVEAITNCKDPKEAKAALRVVVAFAMHDKGIMTDGVGKKGLPTKIILSLLMVSINNMSKKGGE